MKKIFYILKNVVVICMILCMISSSYASLSASDGSSFVTRKDFDNALSDFSSRLTTFEAGVNTKIDSQVTSYLDRNGIWNGEKQVLNSDATKLKYENFTAPAGASANRGGEVNMISNYVYIPKISKTGMLVGTWSWKATGGNDNNTRWGYYGNMNDQTAVRSVSGFHLVLKFEEYSQTGAYIDLPYSAIVLQAQGDSNGNKQNTEYNICASISTETLVNPYKFFVNKNSCIKWNLILYYRSFNVSSFSRRTDTNSKISIFLHDAIVY